MTFGPKFLGTVLTCLAPLGAVLFTLFGELGTVVSSLFEPIARVLK
jgi:hypothetical protein